MKKIWNLLLCLVVALSSCENKDEFETIRQLSEKFFSYANQENSDSIGMIYPGIETSYLDLNLDSLRIVQINKIDENRIDIQLIKNYSPDSNPSTNKQKSIILNFEKCDSLPWGYKIYNSIGLLDMEMVPEYAVECGAIKDKKYEDKDGIERINIAKILYHEKAKEVAEYLNNNVEVLVNYRYIYGNRYAIVDLYTGEAPFALNNPTEYSCLGFTVSLTLSDVADMSLLANLNGSYEHPSATLQAYSKHNYYIKFRKSDLNTSKPDWDLACCITAAKFHISPEAIEKYTILNFSGSEYDNYIKKGNKGNKTTKETKIPSETK